MSSQRTFWDLAEIFTPLVCRLLARKKYGRPLNDKEIADAAGMEPLQSFWISRQTNWSGIDLPTMRKFLTGCGVDLCNSRQMKRHINYLRKGPRWTYLKKSPDWKTYYEPLIRTWSKK